MHPDEIARNMNGVLRSVSPGRDEALLPSPMIQNHAAFLHLLDDGALVCAWFGGTLEGKSDISIFASVLTRRLHRLGTAQRLSDDPSHSEHNPVLFSAPDGDSLALSYSQPSGNQDECRIRMAEVARDPRIRRSSWPNKVAISICRVVVLSAPPVVVRDDGAWLLPIFRCVQRPGQKWNGSHDTAAVGVSDDGGKTWRLDDIDQSTGCVHMSPVALAEGRYAAFFRRRQADFVYRSDSADGGGPGPCLTPRMCRTTIHRLPPPACATAGSP